MGGEGVGCVDSPTRYFVHELIDWERVRRRLRCYPAIGRAFPESMLRKSCDKPPFYCHCMAWRLGTWNAEDPFANLETLLCRAEELPNWEHEAPLLNDGDYGSFWSLLWQLQVAGHLCEVGEHVRWSEAVGGPDLSVVVDGRRWYVECYNVQKSYGLLQFLQECLSKILWTSVQDDYDQYSRMSLPRTNAEIACFLNEHLKPFCSSTHREKAMQSDVKIVYDEPNKVKVVLEDRDNEEEESKCAVGSPRRHVAKMVQEALKNKIGKNRLPEHRPNVLAVNLLLTGSAAAESLRPNAIREMAPDLGETSIDVLAASSGIGIVEPRAHFAIASMRSDENSEAAKWLER